MKKETSLKLWETANLIAGFSAVQTMGFLFLAIQLNKGLTATLIDKEIQCKVVVGTVVGTILYCVAIYLCYVGSRKLLQNDSEWNEIKNIHYQATLARIFVSILCEIVTLIVIF